MGKWGWLMAYVGVCFIVSVAEVCEVQMPLLDVAVKWRMSGSVEGEKRLGRE